MVRAKNNNVPLETITEEEAKAIEPRVKTFKRALFSPTTSSVNPSQVVQSMCDDANQEGMKLHRGVRYLKRTGKGIVKTTHGNIEFGYMVNSAGLYADKIAQDFGFSRDYQILPFKGLYLYSNEPAGAFQTNIYPVPDLRNPFLGVHFTRMVNGDVECGPNAVLIFKREGYGKTDFSFRDTVSALSYGGTWKLFLKNISFGINEYRRAFSKKLFLKTLQGLIPSLTMEDIKPGRAGVRALLLGTDGDTRDDFRIEYGVNSIHVLNAPSPAATASLAIGNEIKEMAVKHFGLK